MSGEKMGGHEDRFSKRGEALKKRSLRYEQAYSKAQAETHPEDVEVAKAITESVDSKQLADVFSGYLQKAGVPPENSNTGALRELLVRPVKGEESVASYGALTNHMTFSTKNSSFVQAKEFQSRGEAIPPEVMMKLQLSYIHEACHAFSRNRVASKDWFKSRVHMKTESGYVVDKTIFRKSPKNVLKEKSHVVTSKSRSLLFEALNEGVTQRIAEEIFLELYRQNGKSGAGEEYLKKFIETRGKQLWQYSIYGNQVDNICERIGEYAGVPKEEVWHAFVRGYFAKPEMFEQETIELFQETFGKGFLDDYSKLKNETPMESLAEFDVKADFSHPGEYAGKWLEHLGISK